MNTPARRLLVAVLAAGALLLAGCDQNHDGIDDQTGKPVAAVTPVANTPNCDPHGFGPLSGCSGTENNAARGAGSGLVPDEGLTQDDMTEAARHEAGHAVVMRAEGGTVTSSVIRPDGSGTTIGSNLPADVLSQVMVDVAGAVGAGTDDGATQDFLDAVHVMHALSPAQREAMVNQARAKDAQILRAHAADFRRITADLLDNGRLG